MKKTTKDDPSPARNKYLVEFFGTLVLVAVVVGSGIMGQNLSSDSGVVLLINAVSTVLALGLLILIFGPVSGAQFNPVVSMALCMNRGIDLKLLYFYLPLQVAGAILGAILANLMFDLDAIQFASNARVSFGTLIGEVVATAGLVAIIITLLERNQAGVLPIAVPAWIGAAYFFTSSTSFANPAVTIGRAFTDTFSGIEPGSVLPFIGAQLVGAAIGLMFSKAISFNKIS